MFDNIFDKQIDKSVRCETCKRIHPADSKDYITVYGDIMIGRSAGVIGHNFDKEEKLARVSIRCKHIKCWQKLFSDNLNNPVDKNTKEIKIFTMDSSYDFYELQDGFGDGTCSQFGDAYEHLEEETGH